MFTVVIVIILITIIFLVCLKCSSKDDIASRALITERNTMRIAQLERRNTELKDRIRCGSDPLELRLQQLTEELSQLQKKLRVFSHSLLYQ